MKRPGPRIAIAYLARGAHLQWRPLFERFLHSYMKHRPGVEHSLYIIFKGFSDDESLRSARALFNSVPHKPLFLEDESFDIGAYVEWANAATEEVICPLNTSSEILAQDWLKKLVVNLDLPDVGLVGVTASYESLNDWNPNFPPFPNPHIRSNAFMMRRSEFCEITRSIPITEKLDAFNFESGPSSMSRQILGRGQKMLLVGRNGRGYAPANWPVSDTFRLRFQNNLLVADNQTRDFNALRWTAKHEFVLRTWGHYICEQEMLE